jgi:hypothetical protein
MAPALAVAWCVGALARPRTAERQATAVVCTLGLAGVLLSLLSAPTDERYVMYAAVPVALAAAAALSELSQARRLGRGALAGVLCGVALVLYLIASTTWSEPVNAYEYFGFPADVFYERVFLARLHKVHLPLVHPSPALLLDAALVLAAIAWLAFARRARRPAAPAALMAAGLLVLAVTQVVYTMHKYTYTAGEGDGATADERSWVDEHVAPGTPVGALALSLGATGDYYGIWRATEFWNTSVNYDVYIGTPGQLPFPLGSTALRLEVNPSNGLISGFSGPGELIPAPLPPYLLVPEQASNEYGLAGKVVAVSRYLPLELLRVSRPARVQWSVKGDSVEGFMASGAPVTVTAYEAAPLGGDRRCATFSLVAPPGFSGSWPYSVSDGARQLASGRLSAQQSATVTVPLTPAAGPAGTPATLTVRVVGQAVLPGTSMTVSAKFTSLKISPCPPAAGG